MADIKVIGTAKCIHSNSYGHYFKGKTYDVLQNGDGGFPSVIINESGKEWHVFDSHLKFEKTIPNPTIEIIGTAECIESHDGFYYEGTTYNVLKVNGDGYPTCIINEYERSWWLYNPEKTFKKVIPIQKTNTEVMTKTIHEQIFETLDIRVGDTVKFTREFKDEEYGCTIIMNSEMGQYVGQTGTVTENMGSDKGWRVSFKNPKHDTWTIPAHCIELVRKRGEVVQLKNITSGGYDAKVKENEIEVGCQVISKSQFNQILKAAVKTKLIKSFEL